MGGGGRGTSGGVPLCHRPHYIVSRAHGKGSRRELQLGGPTEVTETCHARHGRVVLGGMGPTVVACRPHKAPTHTRATGCCSCRGCSSCHHLVVVHCVHGTETSSVTSETSEPATGPSVLVPQHIGEAEESFLLLAFRTELPVAGLNAFFLHGHRPGYLSEGNSFRKMVCN